VAFCPGCAVFGAGQRCNHQDNVSGLLHRHLILFVDFTAAVLLSVCEWINPEIVRCKGKLPLWRLRVSKYGFQLRLLRVFGAEQQEHGRRRIQHVDRGNGTVAEILLRHEERRAIPGLNQLVGTNRLTECEYGNCGVLRTAHSNQVRSSSASYRSDRFSSGAYSRSAASSMLSNLGNCLCQYGSSFSMHVLDGIAIVVAEQNPPRDRRGLHLAKLQSHCEQRSRGDGDSWAPGAGRRSSFSGSVPVATKRSRHLRWSRPEAPIRRYPERRE